MVLGVVALLVGLGTGFLILSHPEGLNPAWPVGMALLAPAVFLLAGLHIITTGLGYARFSGVLLATIALCFLAVANFAAFFTTGFGCVETLSFFGVPILRRQPSEADCRNQLRTIMSCVDALVLLPAAVSVWRKARSRDA
jgi:hypothetical protein